MHEQSTERWSPIPGAPGYEASTHGGVRRRQFFRVGEILTYAAPRPQQGYLYVYVGRERGTVGVHRAVLLAFAGAPPADGKRWSAHHLDRVRDHNCLENLVWVDSAAHGRHHARPRSLKAPQPPRPAFMRPADDPEVLRAFFRGGPPPDEG